MFVSVIMVKVRKKSDWEAYCQFIISLDLLERCCPIDLRRKHAIYKNSDYLWWRVQECNNSAMNNFGTTFSVGIQYVYVYIVMGRNT